MAPEMLQSTTTSTAAVWRLVRRQRSVVARWQLIELGYGEEAIRHRVRTGRLIRLYRGVYAVGTVQLHPDAFLIAAVLAAGRGAALSHRSAAAKWDIVNRAPRRIELSIPADRCVAIDGLVLHRRTGLAAHTTTRHGIAITTPLLTLVDLAATLPDDDDVEAAVNDADSRGLIDPQRLRNRLDRHTRRPGIARLRRLLDQHTRTDTYLERRFLRLSRAAGLPEPLTQQQIHGHRTDFFWPALRLVVETDSLTYHRTPAEQAKDRRRDQDLIAAGYTPLRFTHAQVTADPAHVQTVLEAAAAQATDARDVAPTSHARPCSTSASRNATGS
jgi:very-short-patch-repair endonuclease